MQPSYVEGRLRLAERERHRGRKAAAGGAPDVAATTAAAATNTTTAVGGAEAAAAAGAGTVAATVTEEDLRQLAETADANMALLLEVGSGFAGCNEQICLQRTCRMTLLAVVYVAMHQFNTPTVGFDNYLASL